MRATMVMMILVCLGACSMACGEATLEATASTPAAPIAASDARAEQAPAAAVPAERMVIREARLGLRVPDPRTLLAAATRIASVAGGFVLDSQVQAVDGASYRAELSLRVPEAELDRTLSALHALGTVLEERVEGQDVTEEFVDVSARLHAQRTLESRLLALLDRSAELKDLLATEQELARVRTGRTHRGPHAVPAGACAHGIDSGSSAGAGAAAGERESVPGLTALERAAAFDRPLGLGRRGRDRACGARPSRCDRSASAGEPLLWLRRRRAAAA
jgi:hypothetical protein